MSVPLKLNNKMALFQDNNGAQAGVISVCHLYNELQTAAFKYIQTKGKKE